MTNGDPRRVARYDVLSRIGTGGMGRVYRATHTKLGRTVALKVISERHLGSAGERGSDAAAVHARFEREMRAVGALDHPGIVRAYDADEADGVAYLAMELVDGLDVGRIAATVAVEGREMRTADACEIARRAADALHHAHEAGLVHRDVKPSNLMLSRSGDVKLLDLGLARLMADGPILSDESGPITLVGQVVGTVDYMAPEQTGGYPPADARADVYALCATLYRLLAGQSPFEAHSTLMEKLRALANDGARPLEDVRPDLPSRLTALINSGLSHDRESRPQSAADLAVALEPFCSGSDLRGLGRWIPAAPEYALEGDGEELMVTGSDALTISVSDYTPDDPTQLTGPTDDTESLAAIPEPPKSSHATQMMVPPTFDPRTKLLLKLAGVVIAILVAMNVWLSIQLSERMRSGVPIPPQAAEWVEEAPDDVVDEAESIEAPVE